ncbi:MAG: D-alanyl-D-alanine carboxypeptidase family protein [Desulfotomaculales bacterium]
MRLWFLVVLLVFLTQGLGAAAAAAAPPPVVAGAAILMEADTGQVLYAKNPDASMYPASTTKILTALVVLERCDLDEEVRVPPGFTGVDGSAVYLREGEVFTVRDLLYALLIHSANDAAVILAEHVAGSVDAFAGLMNKKAASTGARHSHFVNPNGLPDENHYTTARDLALIARAAMRHPAFREIVATKNYVLPEREDPEAFRHLWNTNKLLWRYEGANGIKTGYTTQAQQCLVASARREGRELIAVVLGSAGNNVWTDATALLDYGFDGFTRNQIVGANRSVASVKVAYGARDVTLVTASPFVWSFPAGEPSPAVRWTVRLPRPVTAPVQKGQQLGSLVLYSGARRLGAVPLVAADDVCRALWASWWFWTGVVGCGLVLVRYRNYRRRRRYLLRR